MNPNKLKPTASTFLDRVQKNDPAFRGDPLLRSICALIPLGAFLLPWVHLDGSNDSLSGAQLLAFAFTSPERTFLFSTSALGTIALVFAPLALAVTSIASLFLTVSDKYMNAGHLVAGLLPLAMLALARPILSSDQALSYIGPLPIPAWPLLALIASNLALAAHGFAEQSKARSGGR